jgi:hypothetical protein
VQMFGSAAAGGLGSAASPQASPVAAVVYFISFILLGTMVMLNLFIGVIISGMQESQREAETAERERHRVQLRQSTLGDEFLLLERRLDEFQGQLKALRLRAERSTCEETEECPSLQAAWRERDPHGPDDRRAK